MTGEDEGRTRGGQRAMAEMQGGSGGQGSAMKKYEVVEGEGEDEWGEFNSDSDGPETAKLTLPCLSGPDRCGTLVFESTAVSHIGFGGLKHENQDRFGMCTASGSEGGGLLFWVLDGHGSDGRRVADVLHDAIPGALRKRLAAIRDPGSGAEVGAALMAGFADLNRVALEVGEAGVGRVGGEDGYSRGGLDLSLSGSTATVCYVSPGGAVYVAHVGDTRAVVYAELGQGPGGVGRPVASWSSRDHRPELPDERARIEAAGGRVAQRRNRAGVAHGNHRLWEKDSDLPGLMISRSFGDTVAHGVGCTAVPEISGPLRIDPRCGNPAFVVLASDGVWDVLSQEHVGKVLQGDLAVLAGSGSACDVGGNPCQRALARTATRLAVEAISSWGKRHQADNVTLLLLRIGRSDSEGDEEPSHP